MSSSRVKLFTPPLDSTWRLTEDWSIPHDFLDRRDNEQSIFNLTGDTSIWAWEKKTGDNTLDYSRTDGQPNWVDRYHAWEKEQRELHGPYVLPKGTVIVFNRYHISHSGDHAITCQILASPDARLMPRKLGGKGKGPMRIYFKVDELNTLPELEHAQP